MISVGLPVLFLEIVSPNRTQMRLYFRSIKGESAEFACRWRKLHGKNNAPRRNAAGIARWSSGNLLISVGMRAPFAPHMSFGSRATQAKPEARRSLFRAMSLGPLFFADDRRRCVNACVDARIRIRPGIRPELCSHDASCVVVREPVAAKTVCRSTASSKRHRSCGIENEDRGRLKEATSRTGPVTRENNGREQGIIWRLTTNSKTTLLI